jgi:DNA repair exonuclease SbcCD nuclease subunit
MSIVYITDLHLNEWKAFSTILPSGLNSRLVDQVQVVGSIARNLTKEDTVIFGGDLIDSYSHTLSKIIYSAAHFAIKTWAQCCNQLYVIVGNHDVYRMDSIVNVFGEIENVHVVNNTVTENIDGWRVDLVPWGGQIPDSKGDLLFAHLMPLGAWLGSLLSKRADEGVDIKQCSDYIYAVFGHIHEPQVLVTSSDSDATKVLCPGSIMQLNLSSSPAPRYLYRIGVDLFQKVEIPSRKIQLVHIETQEEADKFVDTKGSDYYKLTLTDEDIKLPNFDHTVLVEYETKPKAGVVEMEETKDIDLLGVIDEFIDASSTKIDKKEAKEMIRRIY